MDKEVGEWRLHLRRGKVLTHPPWAMLDKKSVQESAVASVFESTVVSAIGSAVASVVVSVAKWAAALVRQTAKTSVILWGELSVALSVHSLGELLV